MIKQKSVGIIIPAYNPDDKIIKLVKELISEDFTRIIIVNDGSVMECDHIFLTLSQLNECIVLNHDLNQGKGRALKTGFSYYLDQYSESIGVVTVDADGQHAMKDVKAVGKRLIEHPNSLVLGVRSFEKKDIPFRSRFGNELTKMVFRLASGLKVSDTQTGLRGIPTNFLHSLLKIKGEKYEFEMNMLLESKTYNINIEEVKIQTIYIDENSSSHFNPVVDSVRIYSVFLKFISSSILSFGADILLFIILSIFLKEIFTQSFIIYATIGSRILSSLLNYTINRNVVFKSNSTNTLVKYYSLSIVQMFVSALGVQIIYSMINSGEVGIKIIVDAILFFISFRIQREWVFKNNKRQFKKVSIND